MAEPGAVWPPFCSGAARLVVKDASGVDIGEMVQVAAEKYGVPVVGLLALLWAESGLNPHALRQGDWPDWSVGLSQVTVMLARTFGIGDGTPASWETVKAALLDRQTSIDCGAQYFRWMLDEVERTTPGISGDEIVIASLTRYNGGPHPMEQWYLDRYGANLQRYRDGLAWAKQVMG